MPSIITRVSLCCVVVLSTVKRSGIMLGIVTPELTGDAYSYAECRYTDCLVPPKIVDELKQARKTI